MGLLAVKGEPRLGCGAVGRGFPFSVCLVQTWLSDPSLLLLPAGAFGVLAVTMLLPETGAGRGWGGSVHMCWQPTTCQGLPVPYSAGPLVVAKEPQSLGVVCGF